VVPVWLDGLSNSIFSFAQDKKFLRNLIHIPLRAAVAFDKPISGHSADNGVRRKRLVELSGFCFQRRPELSVHLARATVSGLKPHPFDDAFIDGDYDRCEKRGLSSLYGRRFWETDRDHVESPERDRKRCAMELDAKDETQRLIDGIPNHSSTPAPTH
jgi:hypothetical protein